MFTRKNLLIFIARNVAISLGVIALTVFMIFFIAKKINHISNSIALNHFLKAELSTKTGFFEKLKNDAKIIGRNDTLIEDAFVHSDNIAKFINALNSITVEANKTTQAGKTAVVTTNTIKQIYHFDTPAPYASSADFPIATINYSNAFMANISAFSNYLKAFEQLPFFTKIEGFSIASQDKEGWVSSSSITFNATLYTKYVQ